MRTTFKIAVGAAAILAAFGASAQAYPVKDKNITIVVPFSAGGPTDRVARDLAEALRKPLGGATGGVENAAGAGSTIGAAKVARAQPDGYTLLLNHIGMATIPTLYRKLSFNVLNDFEFLGIVNDVPMTIISRPTLEAKNYKELATWIAQNKEKVNLGHSGLGSAGHLCGLMFQHALQSHMTPVAYKGAAPAITDLIGGQIDLMCDQTTNTTTQIEGKKVKAFAVTTNQRLTMPSLKDLPTLQESGLKDFNVSVWHGLYAPKGTPAAVLTRINEALQVAVKDPDFIKKQEGLGAVVVADKRVLPAEHKKFVQGSRHLRRLSCASAAGASVCPPFLPTPSARAPGVFSWELRVILLPLRGCGAYNRSLLSRFLERPHAAHIHPTPHPTAPPGPARHRGASCFGPGRHGRRVCPSQPMAGQAGPHRGAVRRRGDHRHPGARHCARAGQGLWPAVHRGQPRRRGRQHRCRTGGQVRP